MRRPSRLRRSWAAVGIGIGCVLRATPSGAETDVPVRLELRACGDLKEQELRRIVAAELGAVATEKTGPFVTRVSVSCSGPKATLTVQDPLSRKAVQRTIDLGSADTLARTRLVAIASTELVLSSWAELESNPTPTVEPEGPRPPDETRRAARGIALERAATGYQFRLRRWYDKETPAERYLALMAVGSVRSFFDTPGTLLGGGARVGEERFRFMAWSVDLLFETGRVELGSQSFDLKSFTTGGRLLAHGRIGKFGAGVGAGLRVGVAASQGSSSLAPWGWPLGVAAASLRIGTSAVLELSGEASYVVLPLGGDTTLRGAWFSGQLGLGWLIPQAK